MVRLTNKMKPGPMDHQIRHSYNVGLELKTDIGKHESYDGPTN